MNKHQQVIMDTIEGNNNKASWEMISAAIKAAGLTPKNWMSVRNSLQGLLNAKWIARTKDVHNEEYIYLEG